MSLYEIVLQLILFTTCKKLYCLYKLRQLFHHIYCDVIRMNYDDDPIQDLIKTMIIKLTRIQNDIPIKLMGISVFLVLGSIKLNEEIH